MSERKPLPLEAGDVGAAAARNAAIGARVFQGAAAVAPFLAKAAVPLTVAAAGASAGYEGYQAYRAGQPAAEVAKAAGWGAVDSLTLGQLQEGSMTRRAWSTVADTFQGNGPQRMSEEGKAGFAEASAHYEMSHMQHAAAPEPQAEEAGSSGGPRGWANPKVQAAAQAAQGHEYHGSVE